MKKYILILFFSFIKLNAQRNVILIIADDLGSDYCGFYENHVDTVSMPNVRKLLNRGVRFRYAWSNPLCSPTRAGILTGRYSFRTGMGDVVAPGSKEIDTAEITIPRLLKKYSLNKIANEYLKTVSLLKIGEDKQNILDNLNILNKHANEYLLVKKNKQNIFNNIIHNTFGLN